MALMSVKSSRMMATLTQPNEHTAKLSLHEKKAQVRLLIGHIQLTRTCMIIAYPLPPPFLTLPQVIWSLTELFSKMEEQHRSELLVIDAALKTQRTLLVSSHSRFPAPSASLLRKNIQC